MMITRSYKQSWIFSIISLFPVLIFHEQLTLNLTSIAQITLLLLGLLMIFHLINKHLSRRLNWLRYCLFPALFVAYEYLVMCMPNSWCLFKYQNAPLSDVIFLVFACLSGIMLAFAQRRKPLTIVELHSEKIGD